MTDRSETWLAVRPWVGTVARLLIGGVFIWASLAKLSDPLTFVQAVRAYDATPEWLSEAIAYGLPMLELCLGIVLVLGIMVRVAASVSAALFVVFLIGIIQASARGIQLDCGCFGGGGTTESGTSYTLDILRDVGLLIAAVFLIVWPMTRISIEEYLARHDHVPVPSAKRMRTPEGRKRYESQLAMSRATARSRGMWLDGSIAAVVVLVSLIGIGVQSGRAKIENVEAGKFASASNGIVFGKPAAATVDVYEDLGCPVCEQFEQQTHVQLEKDVRANLAQVRYHPISILDSGSPNQYSTRAANALICVSDAGVEPFLRFHDILYGKSGGKQVQPVEGTAGPGDAELTAFAKQAGLTKAQLTTASDCILSQKYKPLVQELTEKASERGVSGTPTLYVNDKKLANHDSATLFNAIAKANKGHTPSPSVTPSPKASGTASSSASPSSSAPAPASASASASASAKKAASTPKSPAASPQ